MRIKIKPIVLALLFLGILILINTGSVPVTSSKKNGVKIPILLYHHIDNKVLNEVIITPEKFSADMNAIKKAGYESITFNDLTLALNGYKELPQKPIIITFDDGYYSNYKYAYPILKGIGMRAVINIIGWSAGRSSYINENKEITPHFTWEEANEMINSGVIEIQNHTYDLHSNEGLSTGYGKICGMGVKPLKNEGYSDYKKRLTQDIIKNNRDIFNNTGAVSTFVAYPFGAYTNETEQVLTEIGIDGTLTTNEGVRYYSSTDDLKKMPRLTVTMEKKGGDLINAIDTLPIN